MRRMALEKLQTCFSVKQSYDGEKLTLNGLMGDLSTGNLFSSKRLVIIHDADKLDKAVTSRLESYFEKPNPDVCLAFSADSLSHSSNFYRKGEKIGIIFEVVEEKPWEKEQSIQTWIAATVTAEGKKITQPASQALVKALGMQQATLYNELQKLICFIGDRSEIQPADIAAVTSSLAVETGWQLGEALFRRDASTALRIAKAILSDGTPLIVLLRQIRSQFQTEYQVSSILATGGDANAVAKQFPYMKGTILERHLGMARGYGQKRFKKALLAIDNAELKSKNSATDPELLLELTIIKLTE